MTAPAAPASTMELAPTVQYTLRLGDDALVLAQRLGEWSAKAPELEEDVALTNIALDLLGQARALLSYAGRLEDAGRDEDALAFLRDERDWVNVQLVEQPGGDFADTIARQLLFSAYQYELYGRLVDSADDTLAAVAAKAVKEVAYHRDHAAQWVIRLGDGTEVSHARMQAGLERMWPYVGELFDSDELERGLADQRIAVDSAKLRAPWRQFVDEVVAEATLSITEGLWTVPGGGRRGIHTESFGYLLAEMQHLHRSHPGARW